MHLALFTDSNIFYIDGVGRITQELVNYIKGHSQHSLIVFHRADGPERAEQIGDNVTVYSVVAPHLHVPTYEAYPFLYLRSPRKRLLRVAQAFKPEIVVTVTPYLAQGIGRSALYIAHKLGVPAVGSFDVHITTVLERYGIEFFKFQWAVRLWLWYAGAMMGSYRRCAKILVPSKFVQEHVQKRYAGARCVLFPRGVDCHVFSPAYRDDAFKVQHGIGGKIAIFYTGRLSVEKNLQALVDAYTELKARHPAIALVLVGDGPEKQRFAAMGVPDLVLLGVLRGADLSRAYASADIFAFPSVVDAGPMVILEAMASGLPVVVTNQGGAQDSVSHGETGFVSKDPADFSAGLDRLIRDGQLRAAMGENARRYAVTQGWERIFDELLMTLAQCVDSTS